MSHLKKIIIVPVLGILTASFSVTFAAPESVLCTTDQIFGDNECNVCYTESEPVTGTGDALEVKDVKIPWKNSQTDKAEVAYELENDIPELISEHKIVTDPESIDDLWKFSNTWTGDIGEYSLAAGKETNFAETNTDGVIKIYGKGSAVSPTLLVKSAIIYHDRTIAKLEETETPKTKNTCILYDLVFSASNANSGNTVTTNTTTATTTNNNTSSNTSSSGTADNSSATNTQTQNVTPPVTTTTANTKPDTSGTDIITTYTSTDIKKDEKKLQLNAAAEVSPEQTNVETGPGFIIFLCLAFIFSTLIYWKKFGNIF